MVEETGLRLNRVGRIMRLLFGDDVFVSYARKDTADYALALADALTSRKVSCFVDMWGSRPGSKVPPEVLRGLLRSTVLVVLGSPASAKSTKVEEEIRAFAKTGRPMIPISFGEALEEASWYDLLRGVSVSREPESALADGRPSGRVIERVANAEGFTRRNVRLRRALLLGVVLLAALGCGSAWLAVRIAAEQGKLADPMKCRPSRSEAAKSVWLSVMRMERWHDGIPEAADCWVKCTRRCRRP